jgi:hypothetical protein
MGAETRGTEVGRDGIYSVWAYMPNAEELDNEELFHTPVFLVLWEWEIAEMRSVELVEAWGSIRELQPEDSQRRWDAEYADLCRELIDPSDSFRGRFLAEMIEIGQLQRLGEMPKWGRFKEPHIQGRSRATVEQLRGQLGANS